MFTYVGKYIEIFYYKYKLAKMLGRDFEKDFDI